MERFLESKRHWTYLQETLYATRGVVRSSPVIPVGQENHNAALEEPLGLSWKTVGGSETSVKQK